jgi:Ser/Thr protein kinase RdoA (MazF antagonist)
MQTIAALHASSARYDASPPGTKWFAVIGRQAPSAVHDRLERITRLDAASLSSLRKVIRNCAMDAGLQTTATNVLELIAGSRDAIQRELSACLDMRALAYPCWRDLWKAHVLFEGDEVTGLIDASAARTDHPAVDLARLLGSLVGDDRRGWQTALDAYTAVRPMSIEEQRLVTVLDRSGTLLSSLTWLERLAANEIAVADAARVQQRLAEFVVRLSQLQSS